MIKHVTNILSFALTQYTLCTCIQVLLFCKILKLLGLVWYIAGGKRGKKVWEVLTMMVTGQTSHITKGPFVTFHICSWIAHVTGEFVVIINHFIMQFSKCQCLIGIAYDKCHIYGFGLHWQFSYPFGLTTLSFIWSNLSFSEICLSMFPFGFCSKIRRARLGKTKGFDKYKVTHQQIHQLMTKINPKHLNFFNG